jgi:hypothetical protein
MVREADWRETIGLGCRGGAGRDLRAGAARRAAIGPARQQTSRQTSAPAVPSSTCPAWAIPAKPAGTTPATIPRPTKPIAVLIDTLVSGPKSAFVPRNSAIETPEIRLQLTARENEDIPEMTSVLGTHGQPEREVFTR